MKRLEAKTATNGSYPSCPAKIKSGYARSMTAAARSLPGMRVPIIAVMLTHNVGA